MINSTSSLLALIHERKKKITLFDYELKSRGISQSARVFCLVHPNRDFELFFKSSLIQTELGGNAALAAVGQSGATEVVTMTRQSGGVKSRTKWQSLHFRDFFSKCTIQSTRRMSPCCR